MAATEAQIRNTVVTRIAAITPVSGAAVPFAVFGQDGDFRLWAEQNKGSALRRFQVTHRPDGAAGMSNVTEEWRWLIIEVIVAYPDDMSGRFGRGNERSRDDVMAEDQHTIEDAIGLRGYGNFSGVACFDAIGSDAASAEPGDGVTFLTFRNRYGYYRSV